MRSCARSEEYVGNGIGDGRRAFRQAPYALMLNRPRKCSGREGKRRECSSCLAYQVAGLSPQTWSLHCRSSVDYVRSSFRLSSLVLFISFLYLCFFIFSFLCLLTLIKSMPPRLLCTCSRNVSCLSTRSAGSATSVIDRFIAKGSNAIGGGGGWKWGICEV
jgi:hypothetical protein